MKKTVKSLLLLVLLGAVLILTGCPKEPVDPTADKGAWVKKEFLQSKISNPGAKTPDFFSTDADTQTVTFLVDDAARTAANAALSGIAEDTFNTYSYTPITGDFIGADVTVTKESGTAGCGYGITVLYNSEVTSSLKSSYFRVLLSYTSYTIDYYQYDPGKKAFVNTEVCPWTPNDAIKPQGQPNNIKLATRNDGKLSLSINGTFITTINVPSDAFKTGEVRAVGGVGDKDAVSGAENVKITWKFNKFQQ